MNYLIMACKPHKVLRLQTSRVASAHDAVLWFRRNGWAVTVLSEVRR